MKTTIACSLLCLASTAFAGSFDGPYIEVGLGGSHTKTTLSGDNHLANSATDPLDGMSSSDNSFNGLLSLGYSKEIGGMAGLNLAANVFYIVGNQSAGAATKHKFLAPFDFYRSYSADLKNTFGISIEPGWNISKSTLGYLKFAWLRTNYDISTQYEFVPSAVSGRFNYSLEKSMNGFGYGLGLKQAFSEHLFAGIDLMAVSYQNQEIGTSANNHYLSAKTTQVMGFASIGYKF